MEQSGESAAHTWTAEEARSAFDSERECIERQNRKSIIISFPDEEITENHLLGLFPGIRSVHTEIPLTPRSCAATLSDDADPDHALTEINKVPFGKGVLKAVFRNEKQIGESSHVDPYTLFVGDVGRITKEQDLALIYPKSNHITLACKRTVPSRHAFVRFANTVDSLEALQTTHGTTILHEQLLRVRFRRTTDPLPESPSMNGDQCVVVFTEIFPPPIVILG